MFPKFQEELIYPLGISPGQGIVLAVSGGVDSMVMLDLFSRTDYELIVAHCNFRLRKEESDHDELFVKNQCRRKNIPFQSLSFNTENYAREKGISIQMAARELRYDWFEKIRIEKGFDYIATAHNQDDQVETFFINLSRGTGIRGLSGINAVSGALIRPLLKFSRNDILKYAKEFKVHWREDSSNSTVHYKRNRLRHEVIPLFKQLNPSFENTMAENLQNLSVAARIYRDYMENRKAILLESKANSFEINIDKILKENYSESVLYEILQEFEFNAATSKDIFHALSAPPGKQFFSPSHQLVKDRDVLIIYPQDALRVQQFYIEENQAIINEPIHLEFEEVNTEGFSIPPYEDIACLDADLLNYPLILRKWRKGDYFHPLGMDQPKKVSDFFIDNKLSLFEKENTWLLCSGQDIVWIVGRRIDNRYKITRETSRILCISQG